MAYLKATVFFWRKQLSTVKSWFKKELNLQIHLLKTLFLTTRFLHSVQNFLMNQIWLDLRKENEIS